MQQCECIYFDNPDLQIISFFQVRMPLYQTKTIANILEPVAQQVLNEKFNIQGKLTQN